MIYVKGGDKAKTTAELLINNFAINEYNVFKFKPTYHDAECTKLQCKQARRSFADLLEIVKTYFPSTTRNKLAYIILNKVPNLICLYCEPTNMLVFVVDIPHSVNGVYWMNLYKKDIKFKDKFNMSFEDIEKLANKYKNAKVRAKRNSK